MTPTFRLFLWGHRLLLLGPGFSASLHRHHAGQIAFALGGMLRVRTGVAGQWEVAEALFIPPDQDHELVIDGDTAAFVFIEPESAECSALEERLGRPGGPKAMSLASGLASACRQLLANGGTIQEAESVCLGLMGIAQPKIERRTVDIRLAKVLDAVRSGLSEPLRAGRLSKIAGVSASWLTHRFGKDLGVSLRRYVLWQRLWSALVTALEGATLTEAAHGAGFADSAHFSRTFRDMFGVAPSMLFEQRGALHIVIAPVPSLVAKPIQER
jgi:AraC-like DNA-binding protein